MMSAARCLALGATVATMGGIPATNLRVTDSRGTEVVVSGAIVDYGSFFSVDNETDGIRVLQGDGMATVKWSSIDTLVVRSVDTTSDPVRASLEVILRNRRRVQAELFQKGRMKLTGRTELGEYGIDLIKVRRIVPAR